MKDILFTLNVHGSVQVDKVEDLNEVFTTVEQEIRELISTINIGDVEMEIVGAADIDAVTGDLIPCAIDELTFSSN